MISKTSFSRSLVPRWDTLTSGAFGQSYWPACYVALTQFNLIKREPRTSLNRSSKLGGRQRCTGEPRIGFLRRLSTPPMTALYFSRQDSLTASMTRMLGGWPPNAADAEG